MSESKSTDQLKLKAAKNEPSGRTVSRHALDPAHRASISHYEISDQDWYSSEISINDLVDELEGLTERLSKPSSSDSKRMLAAQSVLLDKLFNMLAVKGVLNAKAGNLAYSSEYMKLALKAQTNCRTTLQAISEINTPRQQISQINMAENQQVINEFPPNELSGGSDELRTHRGSKRGTSPANSGMEALVEVHRSEDRRGEGALLKK